MKRGSPFVLSSAFTGLVILHRCINMEVYRAEIEAFLKPVWKCMLKKLRSVVTALYTLFSFNQAAGVCFLRPICKRWACEVKTLDGFSPSAYN